MWLLSYLLFLRRLLLILFKSIGTEIRRRKEISELIRIGDSVEFLSELKVAFFVQISRVHALRELVLLLLCMLVLYFLFRFLFYFLRLIRCSVRSKLWFCTECVCAFDVSFLRGKLRVRCTSYHGCLWLPFCCFRFMLIRQFIIVVVVFTFKILFDLFFRGVFCDGWFFGEEFAVWCACRMPGVAFWALLLRCSCACYF